MGFEMGFEIMDDYSQEALAIGTPALCTTGFVGVKLPELCVRLLERPHWARTQQAALQKPLILTTPRQEDCITPGYR